VLAGALIEQTGVGKSDTYHFGCGPFAAKLYNAAGTLTRTVISSANFSRFDELKTRTVVVGCKCKSSVAALASIIIDDGVTTTRGGEGGNGTYHSGDSAEHWLYAEHVISSSATKLEVKCDINASASVYFGGVVFGVADTAPRKWPGPQVAGIYNGGLLSNGFQFITGEKYYDTRPAFRPGSADSGGTPVYPGRIGGVIYRDNSSVGNVGGGEDNLMTYTTPTNLLDANGCLIRVTACGLFAANGNTKTVKMYFGAQELTAAQVTGAFNGKGWRLQSEIIRLAASGAAAQMASFSGVAVTSAFANFSNPSETSGGAIVIKCTGESGAAASNDVVQSMMIVEFFSP
jgi:hypothetical protein